MSELKRARYTLEFKMEAVRLVKAGQSLAAVSAMLSVATQSISDRDAPGTSPRSSGG